MFFEELSEVLKKIINNKSNVDLPAITSSLNQNVSDLIYNGSVRNYMEKQPEHSMFAQIDISVFGRGYSADACLFKINGKMSDILKAIFKFYYNESYSF